jgi:hypothetical protein
MKRSAVSDQLSAGVETNSMIVQCSFERRNALAIKLSVQSYMYLGTIDLQDFFLADR